MNDDKTEVAKGQLFGAQTYNRLYTVQYIHYTYNIYIYIYTYNIRSHFKLVKYRSDTQQNTPRVTREKSLDRAGCLANEK